MMVRLISISAHTRPLSVLNCPIQPLIPPWDVHIRQSCFCLPRVTHCPAFYCGDCDRKLFDHTNVYSPEAQCVGSVMASLCQDVKAGVCWCRHPGRPHLHILSPPVLPRPGISSRWVKGDPFAFFVAETCDEGVLGNRIPKCWSSDAVTPLITL